MVRVDDDGGVESFRQPRIARRAEDGTDVRQVFHLHPLADDLQHRRLDVFGVHDAVRSDAPRDVEREPGAARPQIGDDRSVRDAERIHDLLGLLPLIAIGGVEQAEIVGLEELALRRTRLGRIGWRGRKSRKNGTVGQQQQREQEHALHDRPAFPVAPASPACPASPAPVIPPRVIASTERI